MKIVVIEAEGLRAEYLGPYGSDWVETPAFNWLAAEGFVFDHCLIGSPHHQAGMVALWTGIHPARYLLADADTRKRLTPTWRVDRQTKIPENSEKLTPTAAERTAKTLAQWCQERGYLTALISPEESVLNHPAAEDFEEHILVKVPGQQGTGSLSDKDELITEPEELVPQGEPAADWSFTRTAYLISELTELVDRRAGPALVWCHLPDLATHWDAPLEMRRYYQEEGDPPIWPGGNVPRAYFGAQADPDLFLPFTQSYAAQVEVLDLCLAGLWGKLQSLSEREPWVLVMLSPRGLPLGEHGWLGSADQPLHAELLHVPLMIAFSDGRGQAERSQALVYPHDLTATLVHLVAAGEEELEELPTAPAEKVLVPLDGQNLLPVITGQRDAVRDRLFCYGTGTLAIRTPAWFAQIRLLDISGETGPTGTQDLTPLTPEDLVEESAAPPDQSPPDRILELRRLAESEDNAATELEIEELRRRVRLFVKPDDRWEVNEVADRCPDVATELLRLAAEWVSALCLKGDQEVSSGQIAMRPLADILLKGPEA